WRHEQYRHGPPADLGRRCAADHPPPRQLVLGGCDAGAGDSAHRTGVADRDFDRRRDPLVRRLRDRLARRPSFGSTGQWRRTDGGVAMMTHPGLPQLLVIVVYLGLLLALALLSNRWLRGTKTDYQLASHSIGPVLLLLSLFGTTMTGFALVGSSGEAFRSG